MVYEILDNGAVTNTIVATPEWVQENLQAGGYRLADEPVVPATPPPASVINPTEWLIDIGPFFDRFGAAKMAVLTSADAGVRAILADLQVRKWIDLKRPDVGQGVQYVGSVVPTVTVELQASILNDPVTDFENLALRKVYFA